MLWHSQLSCHDLTVKLFVILTSVRELSAEEGEQEDARGVYVGGRPAEFYFPDDLGSHVGGSSAEHLDLLVVCNTCGESKVNEFHVSSFVQHYILKFYISMCYALAVQVV